MIAKRVALTTMALAIGALAAIGLFWALINVPESNVLALALSALLIVLMAVVAAVTASGAAVLAQNLPAGETRGRLVKAIVSFAIGVGVVGIIWLVTSFFDNWWLAHRGEIDAIFLRNFGLTRTAPLHRDAEWATWLIRWGVGLSLIAGLLTMSVRYRSLAVFSGIRLGLRAAPLAAAVAGVILVSQALGRLVYWRPQNLPPTWVQPAFAGAKLVVLFVLASLIAAAVLTLFGVVAAKPANSD
jgi:hypothetical protein